MRKPPLFAVVFAGAGLLAGTAYVWQAWRAERQEAIVRAALPAIPDLTGWPRDYAVRVRVATLAARQGDDPVAALRELALLYHANRQYQQAAQAERGLLRLQPWNGRWAYLLADACEKLSDSVGQQRYLTKTLQVAPYYPAAHIQMADLLMKSGLSGPARTQYEDYLAMVPGEPHARLALARIKLDAGDRNAAIADLLALVRDHPYFVEAHNLLAGIYASAGDTRRAREQRHLGQATGEGQQIDDPWLNWMYAWSFDPILNARAGDAATQAQAIGISLPLYRRAWRRAPRDPEACEALGGLYLQLGRLGDAEAVLKQGLERTPRAAVLYDTLSRTLRKAGQGQKAVQTLRRGISAAPSSPLLPYHLGLLLESQGHRKDAVSLYRTALRFDPSYADADWSLGLSLLDLGDTSGAALHLGRALELQPHRADDLYTQADNALTAGKLPAAECCLRVLMQYSPGLPIRSLLKRGLSLSRRTGNTKATREFSALLARTSE